MAVLWHVYEFVAIPLANAEVRTGELGEVLDPLHR
jgi:hypothetical protein